MKKKRFVQIKNPKTKNYVLIDRDRGEIIAYSNPDRPFHRITIVSYKKHVRKENDHPL